jgi:hypothetical protein
MANDYTAAVNQAGDIPALQAAMNQIDAYAQSEKQLQGPLKTSETMWNKAGEAIDGVLATFPKLAGDLLTSWRSPADSSLFQQAAHATTSSLTASRNSIGRPGGQSGGGFSIPDALFTLSDVITLAAYSAGQAKTELDQAVTAFNAVYGNGLTPALPAGKGGGGASMLRSAAEQQFLQTWRPVVVQAGQGLNALAQAYQTSGQQIVAAAQGLKWAGPGAGSTSPAGPQAAGPSPAMPTMPTMQTMPSGPSGPGGPGSPPTAGGPGTAGDVAGAGPAGADAGPAGAGPAGAGPGAAGGVPAGPGGTGLAGLDTLPKPLPTGSLPTPSLPGTGLPSTGIPVGGIPLSPLTPGSGLTPVGQGLGGKSKLPGVGGLGGGGRRGGDLAGGRPGVGITSAGEQAIARAGEQTAAPQQAVSGRPPAPPGASGVPATAAPASGAGAPPPMMPPGAMSPGGGGRGGKPGTGAIRPGGRARNRQTGETPGVPAGLRGKAGKTPSGAFPSVLATTRRSQEREQNAETLQLLDEELWKVEETEPAGLKQPRRLAN